MQTNRIVYRLNGNGTDTAEIDKLLCTLGAVSRFVAGGIAGIENLRDREPGCILVDVDATGIDTPAIFDALSVRRAHLPVIVLSAETALTKVIDIMRLGACDYLLKPLHRATLATSLIRVLDRLHDETLLYERRQHALDRIENLTDREQDILRGLLAGHANKMLAHDLGLSIRTVEMHRSNLMTRLDVQSLAQAIRLACDAGIDLDAAPSHPQRAKLRGGWSAPAKAC